MTRDEIIKWAISKGWWLNQWGNLTKTWDYKVHRLKLGKKKVRYEIHQVYDEGDGYIKRIWVRISSAFYKDLSISNEGKLMGMRRGL